MVQIRIKENEECEMGIIIKTLKSTAQNSEFFKAMMREK